MIGAQLCNVFLYYIVRHGFFMSKLSYVLAWKFTCRLLCPQYLADALPARCCHLVALHWCFFFILQYVFGSLLGRDNTYRVMYTVWKTLSLQVRTCVCACFYMYVTITNAANYSAVFLMHRLCFVSAVHYWCCLQLLNSKWCTQKNIRFCIPNSCLYFSQMCACDFLFALSPHRINAGVRRWLFSVLLCSLWWRHHLCCWQGDEKPALAVLELQIVSLFNDFRL